MCSLLVLSASNPSIIRWSVSGLLFERRPTAILRSVITIAVNTVKSHAIRTLTHVREEINEAATLTRIPTVTDRYAASTVAGIRGILGRVTPVQHRRPTLISRSIGHAVRSNAANIGLLSTLGANLDLCFSGVLFALHPRRVVTAEKTPRVSLYPSATTIAIFTYFRFLSTTTFTETRGDDNNTTEQFTSPCNTRCLSRFMQLMSRNIFHRLAFDIATRGAIGLRQRCKLSTTAFAIHSIIITGLGGDYYV